MEEFRSRYCFGFDGSETMGNEGGRDVETTDVL